MPITDFTNLNNSELDSPVWRYLTFPKYVALLSYGALWFPKLNILQDKFEGTMPTIADAELRAQFEPYRKYFPPSVHDQFDQMNQKNVDDGRELTVVSCWFMASHESEKMWDEYVGQSEGVAIVSSVRSLAEHVHFCWPQFTAIGKIDYIDFSTYEMTKYKANQAHERSFLKDKKYRHENELRISTMSLRGPMSVGTDGEPLGPDEYQGAGMNNFEYDGLYIRADLREIIKATVLKPGSSPWFEMLIKRLVKLSNIGSPVRRSNLEI